MNEATEELAHAARRWAGKGSDRDGRVAPEIDRAIGDDVALAGAARHARSALISRIEQRIGIVAPRFANAILAVPRERFVLPEHLAEAAIDAPLPLDRKGLATISAPHAYVLTFGLLDLDEGDRLLELGTGTGYGASLAQAIVGPRGAVTSIEIDPALHERAKRLLGGLDGEPIIDLILGDARALAPAVIAARGPTPLKIAVTYAMHAEPTFITEAMPEGSVLVAPVDSGLFDQVLLRWERRADTLTRTEHGAVRYVPDRSATRGGL